jgi:hypothetical protein
MLSRFNSRLGGTHPYRCGRQRPRAAIRRTPRDRAPALAFLAVFGWSSLRFLFPDGHGFGLERTFAVLIALGAAVSLWNEESLR